MKVGDRVEYTSDKCFENNSKLKKGTNGVVCSPSYNGCKGINVIDIDWDNGSLGNYGWTVPVSFIRILGINWKERLDK